jgi:hypothetical protein
MRATFCMLIGCCLLAVSYGQALDATHALPISEFLGSQDTSSDIPEIEDLNEDQYPENIQEIQIIKDEIIELLGFYLRALSLNDPDKGPLFDFLLDLSPPKSIIDGSSSADSLVARACGGRTGSDETLCLINAVEKLQEILQEILFEADVRILSFLDFYLDAFFSDDQDARLLPIPKSIIDGSYSVDSLVSRACGGRIGSDETLCLIDVIQNLQEILQEIFSEAESQIKYLNLEVQLNSETVDFSLMQYQRCLITLWEERTNADNRTSKAAQFIALAIFIVVFGFIMCLFWAWKLRQVSAQLKKELQSFRHHPHICSLESI